MSVKAVFEQCHRLGVGMVFDIAAYDLQADVSADFGRQFNAAYPRERRGTDES